MLSCGCATKLNDDVDCLFVLYFLDRSGKLISPPWKLASRARLSEGEIA